MRMHPKCMTYPSTCLSVSDGSENTCSCWAPQLPTNLEADLADAATAEDDASEEEDHPSGAKFDSLVETGSSELGIRYPTLQAIFGGKTTRQRIQVHAYHW
jgi:hypothetical protein